jgi:nicotinate-nucleotide adenylyltransferase
MNQYQLQNEILRLSRASRPEIILVKPAKSAAARLGVFASSFNPITNAHLALIEQAASQFSLEQVLALAGVSNADKQDYDCPLLVRLEMLELALRAKDNVSMGISSTPFFVDMIDAIAQAFPSSTSPYFIVGFDTFVRIIDFEGRYLNRYYRSFSDPSQPLTYLLSKGHLIVAARSGQGATQLAEIAAREPRIAADRVLFLDFPPDLAERSATEVRNRIRDGAAVTGLVPPSVEHYILTNRLYGAR